MPLLTVNGSKMHILEVSAEKDDPVILTHGLFMSLAAFFFTVALPLSEQHRVILYDLRGHGRSDRRDEPYTPDLLSGDLLGIMDVLEIPRAHLVSYSYGGSPTLYTALHHPERVNRMALVEAVFIDEASYRKLQDDEVTEAARLDRDMENYTATTGISITESQAERMRSLNRHILEQRWRERMYRSNQEVIEEVSRQQLAVPTLVLYGDESNFLDMGHMLAANIPTAEFRTIAGDHNLLAEHGDLIADHLTDFLKPV
jgi:pimeloyl-ACP methyl ester carboxylesterase